VRAVDTGVLVCLIARDDPKQVAVAEAFVASGAWVPHITLAETTWVLASLYERSSEAVATAVEMLLNHRQLTFQDEEVVRSAVAQFRAAPATSFSDCLIVEIARKAGHGPLGTFDKALGQIEGVQRLE